MQTRKILHSLAQLPENARVLILGTHQADKTFRNVLKRLRPDIRVVNSAATGGATEDHQSGDRSGNFIGISESSDLVIIASDAWRDLVAKVEQQGIDRYLVTNNHFYYPVIQEYFDREEINTFWLKLTGIFSAEELVRYQGAIQTARNMLLTEEDRQLYDLVIANRSLEPQQDLLLAHYLENFRENDLQYFEFINIHQIKTIIEGGVADGNTTYQCLRKIGPNVALYGFEPDKNLYLAGSFHSRLAKYPAVNIQFCALWANNTNLRFLPGSQEEAGRVIETTDDMLGTEDIAGLSLDSFVAENGLETVDFIKLDVEGGEPMVLKGAERTIRDFRPQLAISLYHQKEHLFAIPCYLHELLTDYVYRLGSYHPTHGEKILYAIPRELYGA